MLHTHNYCQIFVQCQTSALNRHGCNKKQLYCSKFNGLWRLRDFIRNI